jgi:hypothetical protein
MEKKQHMRWTKTGAQMLFHARCALINGELGKYTGWSPTDSSLEQAVAAWTPRFFPVPILIAEIWPESDPVYNLPAIDIGIFNRRQVSTLGHLPAPLEVDSWIAFLVDADPLNNPASVW